jgi:hypothetical protein
MLNSWRAVLRGRGRGARVAQQLQRELRVARGGRVDDLLAQLHEHPRGAAARAVGGGRLRGGEVCGGVAEERAGALLVARPEEVSGLRAHGGAVLGELEHLRHLQGLFEQRERLALKLLPRLRLLLFRRPGLRGLRGRRGRGDERREHEQRECERSERAAERHRFYSSGMKGRGRRGAGDFTDGRRRACADCTRVRAAVKNAGARGARAAAP